MVPADGDSGCAVPLYFLLQDHHFAERGLRFVARLRWFAFDDGGRLQQLLDVPRHYFLAPFDGGHGLGTRHLRPVLRPGRLLLLRRFGLRCGAVIYGGVSCCCRTSRHRPASQTWSMVLGVCLWIIFAISCTLCICCLVSYAIIRCFFAILFDDIYAGMAAGHWESGALAAFGLAGAV